MNIYSPAVFFCVPARWAVTVPILCLSVHVHAPWAAPACKRGAVLGDCAALGETHGFWPATCLFRPQVQADGAPTWASAGLAVFWVRTSSGTKTLHKYMGCPHTWRAGGRWTHCQQTWVHQLWTCKFYSSFFVLHVAGGLMGKGAILVVNKSLWRQIKRILNSRMFLQLQKSCLSYVKDSSLVFLHILFAFLFYCDVATTYITSY